MIAPMIEKGKTKKGNRAIIPKKPSEPNIDIASENGSSGDRSPEAVLIIPTEDITKKTVLTAVPVIKPSR